MSRENYNPITDKFLERNDLFALKWNEGLTFLQVLDWETYKYKPYEDLEDIPPESNLSGGFGRLEDENGDDILHVDDDSPMKILHVGIGQQPHFIRRYTNYPESEARLRTMPNMNAPRPGTGAKYGYVDGSDSPYENPTDAEELMVPRGVHLDFDFYNPHSTDSHSPTLNITMREYRVEALDPNENENAVKRAMSPGGPVPTYPVGSMDSQVSFDLQRHWNVSPLSVQEAQNFGRQ